MKYQLGEIVNQRYEVISILGQGGTAITYEVKDLESQNHVAMKVLALNQINDWKVIDLFEREAKALANLNHPKIPQYIDYFYLDIETTRCFYLIQELIIGRSLANLVEKGWHFQENEVREIAQQILSILVYLHSLNPTVIHRDIKPSNLKFHADGRLMLVDFGISKQLTPDELTRLGARGALTRGYAPPEQYVGGTDERSDIFAVGGVIYYLLTGKVLATIHNTHYNSWLYLMGCFFSKISMPTNFNKLKNDAEFSS